ncbi:hypothetical protein C4566_03680 [Candidatus Parcubacteria bacterium]|nr:MAG: hypothetical protein C4566_03680 [Candidatus Parcubacteria bacterium]
MDLIDFSATKEDDLFPSPLIQGKRIKYPAGTYQLVRIANPGDPTIFVHDLLVLKHELDKGRIIGQSVPSWHWAATSGFCLEHRVSITPLKVLLLTPSQPPAEDMTEDDSTEAASAS